MWPTVTVLGETRVNNGELWPKKAKSASSIFLITPQRPMTACWHHLLAISSNCLVDIVYKFQARRATLFVGNAMFDINLVKTPVFG